MKEEYKSRGKKSASRKKRKLRYIGIGLFIMILIVTWDAFSIGAKNENDKQYEKIYRADAKNIVDLNMGPVDKENGQKGDIYMNVEDIDDWRILLVNAHNPIPRGYPFKLSNIDDIRQFDSRATDDLMKLIEDCRDQTGSSIWVQSSYRDRSTQEKLFNDKVEQYVDEGRSRKEAERLASSSVSEPGTSEHEIGLAVDFNNVDLKFEKSSAFKWLMENSHEYGFILRYPKDKQLITGVTYEPWHFRYVGKDHANMMKLHNFCLEEYIDYLKEQGKNR